MPNQAIGFSDCMHRDYNYGFYLNLIRVVQQGEYCAFQPNRFGYIKGGENKYTTENENQPWISGRW